ncbi:hypothetical protein E2C01_022570 [Portunus trituberculatus]|uniref:Uncharacterized protein n=1 Tax=Portunus trituberculatus TaxID=210409 RepID=A0A5B7E5Q6_PORTR|nr:hypothetical protein [Portunus trituberculatus]
MVYLSVLCTKTKKCRQNTYLSKELKYVKNGLFWFIQAFYAPKLRNASKTLYL